MRPWQHALPEQLSAAIPMPARATETPRETLALEERIRRRAYELYVLRGNQLGSELDDWLRAEEEIRRAEEDAVTSSPGVDGYSLAWNLWIRPI